MNRLLTYLILLTTAVMMASFDHGDGAIEDNDHIEDSIRNILYNQKSNKVLKESFLGELYIRGVIEPEEDSLVFQFDFDLHAYDCGAPDCYYNRFTFAIKWDQQKVEFPEDILVTDAQDGCIPGKTSKSRFKKLESNKTNILYYSSSAKQHLVIGSEASKVSYMMCFDGTAIDDIRLNNLIKLTQNPVEEENAPWRSTQIETIEYQLFLTE